MEFDEIELAVSVESNGLIELVESIEPIELVELPELLVERHVGEENQKMKIQFADQALAFFQHEDVYNGCNAGDDDDLDDGDDDDGDGVENEDVG